MDYTEEHLAEYVPMAHALARKIEWSADDHEDLVQEGLVALLKSMRQYAKSGKPVDNPTGLASYVMQGWMKWFYTAKDRSSVYCELQEDHIVGPPEADSAAFIADFLQALHTAHGAIARAVAEAMLSPGPDVAAVSLREATGKAARAAQGELVRGYQQVRVTQAHIREALQLEETQWYAVLRLVRGFTRNYLRQKSLPTA